MKTADRGGALQGVWQLKVRLLNGRNNEAGGTARGQWQLYKNWPAVEWSECLVLSGTVKE